MEIYKLKQENLDLEREKNQLKDQCESLQETIDVITLKQFFSEAFANCKLIIYICSTNKKFICQIHSATYFV